MKGLVIVGVLLIVLGLAGLLAGGLTYTKNKEKADLGPVDITVTEKKHVPVPPAVGAIAVVAGVVLVVAGMRRTT